MARRATAVKDLPAVTIPPPKEGVRIEYRALSDLLKWPRNPKKHDVPGIKASIERFGYVAPIVHDEKSGRMVAGHGRLESLLELKADFDKKKKGIERPRNVHERGGEWYVPVLRGNSFKNEQEAEAYLLADNRHVETGGWDDELLRSMMKQFHEDPNLEALGWTRRELDILLKPPVTIEPGETPNQKMIGFLASEVKQIVLILPSDQYEETLKRLSAVMEKHKLKSHTEAFLHLLNFHETRSR